MRTRPFSELATRAKADPDGRARIDQYKREMEQVLNDWPQEKGTRRLSDAGPSRAWIDDVRRIHDQQFDVRWSYHVSRINSMLGLNGHGQLQLPHPVMPPPWFNGDIERLVPDNWVLVVSLNPHIDPTDTSLHGTSFSAQGWWDYWREFNRTSAHWKGQFFPRLVKLAARCLDEDAPANMNEFAATRMLFIELCPYASPSFSGWSWSTVKRVAEQDVGFATARLIRQTVFEHGRPRLVLCNGRYAAWDVKDQQCPEMEQVEVRLSRGAGPAVRLWRGTFRSRSGAFPVIGFNQLGRRNSRPNEETEGIVALAGQMMGCN